MSSKEVKCKKVACAVTLCEWNLLRKATARLYSSSWSEEKVEEAGEMVEEVIVMVELEGKEEGAIMLTLSRILILVWIAIVFY